MSETEPTSYQLEKPHVATLLGLLKAAWKGGMVTSPENATEMMRLQQTLESGGVTLEAEEDTPE